MKILLLLLFVLVIVINVEALSTIQVYFQKTAAPEFSNDTRVCIALHQVYAEQSQSTATTTCTGEIPTTFKLRDGGPELLSVSWILQSSDIPDVTNQTKQVTFQNLLIQSKFLLHQTDFYSRVTHVMILKNRLEIVIASICVYMITVGAIISVTALISCGRK